MPNYILTWIHLIAAVTLIGGMVFLHVVVRPVFKEGASLSAQAETMRRVGRRFRTLAWISLITLILTGAYQMLNESGSARIETEWGVVLMLKLLVFAITFGLILIHDFIVDPYGPSAKWENEKFKHGPFSTRAMLLQQAILVLSMTILLIAAYLNFM